MVVGIYMSYEVMLLLLPVYSMLLTKRKILRTRQTNNKELQKNIYIYTFCVFVVIIIN